MTFRTRFERFILPVLLICLVSFPRAMQSQLFARAVTTPEEAEQAAKTAVASLTADLKFPGVTVERLLEIYTRSSVAVVKIRFQKDAATCERIREAYQIEMGRDSLLKATVPPGESARLFEARLALRRPIPPSRINPECSDKPKAPGAFGA